MEEDLDEKEARSDDVLDHDDYSYNDEWEKDGPYERSFYNKSLVIKGICKNGKPNGPFQGFLNGKLVFEGIHKDGKINGIYKKYAADGSIKEEIFYKDGEPISNQNKINK